VRDNRGHTAFVSTREHGNRTKYCKRLAGLSWPLPTERDDEELSARPYPRAEIAPRYPMPDLAAVQTELAH
jgi:hypothetical protein